MNEYSISSLTGYLASDAPGLTRDLSRAFEPRATGYLSACYHESASWGGLREPLVERDPEVTFNPRPARIAQILLKETLQVSVFSLSVTFLSTVPVHFQAEISPVFSKQKQALIELLDPEHCDPMLRNIIFATTLDTARRLHLMLLSPEVKQVQFQTIQQQVAEWQTDFSTPENLGLFSLLTQWIEFSARKYTLKSERA